MEERVKVEINDADQIAYLRSLVCSYVVYNK